MKNLLPRFLYVIIAAGAAGSGLLAQQPPPVSAVPSTRPARAPQVAPAGETKQGEGRTPDANTPAAGLPDTKVPATPPPLPESGVAGSSNDNKQDQDMSESVLPKDRRSPYIIGPEDVLMIKVWQEGNLSGPVTVGPDGMISLQLIDEVKADGLTPEQLKNVLTTRLKAFIVNPDVNVQVIRVVSRRFILQGEVNRPGAYPLTGPTTFMEALVYGGGFREFANNKKIYLLRTEINPTTKKAETKRFNFNYREVSHGKHMEQNILVQNGDQIFVP